MNKMITKVEIENFQSHEKTILELVPGTNVIIGETDAGKSAVFRAIRWVVENRPLGDGFRSEWGGDTRVAIYTMEGNVIERIRTASRNEYRINGKVLAAFGHEVPEEVAEILAVDSANIHAQTDPPFLLSATPGEAARMLNRAASLEDIDRVTAALRKDYHKIDGDIKRNREQLQNYIKQMERFENIPVLESKLQQIEEMEKAREEKGNILFTLKRLASRAEDIEFQLEKLRRVPSLWEKCEEANEELLTYQNRVAALVRSRRLVEKAREITEELERTEKLEPAAAILKEALRLAKLAKEKADRLKALKLFFRQAQRFAEALEDAQEEIRRAEEEYNRIAGELKICPLCGNRMKGN